MKSGVTFRSLDGRTYDARIKNGQATVGSVAGKLAARVAGYAGGLELIATQTGQTLEPNTKLDDLPEECLDITMAPELTPA